MRVTPEEAMLAGAIAQSLIARGEFGEGPFEGRLFKSGHKMGEAIEWDPDAMQGLVSVACASLQIARAAIQVAESAVNARPDGDEWKDGQEPDDA